jgi:saccharopine dehydrogenase-like NADP-dependent oxidoreductase
MARTHWMGAGLSSVPGIRRLGSEGHALTLWNRTLDKAEHAIAGLNGDVDARVFDLDQVADALEPGDVAVSMLPADWHVRVAEAALDAGAHFVSSSYIAPPMRALDARGRKLGLCLINECGLDPGLDHMLAHLLIADYRTSGVFDKDNAHYFRSYCGGFPKVPNDFRYKFSWSPLGVLKALISPSRSLLDGEVIETQRPWDALSSYTAKLPEGEETFQAYPNRDSLPFMAEYGMEDGWNVQQFVRGTLRLDGWSDAWADVFREVETLSGEARDKRLKEMSDEFWLLYAYDEGEPDRVVLCVELQVDRDGETVWHKSYALDAAGDAAGSAMGRLVSIPVSLVIEAVLSGRLEPGVHAAPNDVDLIRQWLKVLGEGGDNFTLFDHLS